MSLYKYEFPVPPDLEKDLKEAGIYVNDTDQTRIIREPIVAIRDRIRQEPVEDAPVLMPPIGDIINPEAVLEPPFHVFQELPACSEPELDARTRLLRDIIAIKPEMRNESFSDMQQTYDLVMRLEPFCDNDPPQIETLLWARLAAHRIAGIELDQAEAVYTRFMTDYMIDPNVIDSSDTSLIESAERWLEIVKATDPVQYGHIQACVDFIRPQNGSREIIEHTIGVTLLQIAHRQEMATIETSSELFSTDAVDPLGELRYRAPKVGHRGFDVTGYTPDELADHMLLGELLANPAAAYDPNTSSIDPQTDDAYKEPELGDKQKMLIGLLDVAAIAMEERKNQLEIRTETTDMTRRMGYSPTTAAVEKAYVVRHVVHHMLGLKFTDKAVEINALYSNDMCISDVEWVVRAKKLLQDLRGNEEFETTILAGVNFLLPDADMQAFGQLIAAVSYDQIKHYQSVKACEKGAVALDAAYWQLTHEPETLPAAREEPSLDVIRHGLAATGFTEDQLVHLPLRELIWRPGKSPHPRWNRLRRQRKSEYNDPELTQSQKFALDILAIKGRADREVISGSLVAFNSADMARKLVSKNADMRAFKLTHRARRASALICDVEDFHRYAAEIYKIHTDVPIVTIGRPPLASVADDAQINLYRYESTAKTIEACALLLGDSDEDTEILRSALCLAIDQIHTWRQRNEQGES